MSVCQSSRVQTNAPPLLDDLVERLATGGRAPGGGSAAAATVVLAAAVVEKAARLRTRASPLVEADAEAYAVALAALAGDAPAGGALERAADVLLELAGIACDVALLASQVADLGDPSLRPDAQADEDELKAHVRDNLARYKVPRDVVFVDELPRNPTGKVLKAQLG